MLEQLFAFPVVVTGQKINLPTLQLVDLQSRRRKKVSCSLTSQDIEPAQYRGPKCKESYVYPRLHRW